MISRDKRVRVITGHYGSGKSEFAVSYAHQLNALRQREAKEKGEEPRKVVVCDLDIVNTYFRSRELGDEFEEQGIRVISSALGNNTTLDIPMISAEIKWPLIDKKTDAIIDLGGDPVGAKVLIQYKEQIDPEETDVFFIFNAYRERTETAQQAYEYMRQIEDTIGLKVTGIINNTHLLQDTTAEDLMYGQKIAEELSDMSGVRIAYISGIKSALDNLPKEVLAEKFIIEMLMREKWQRREYG